MTVYPLSLPRETLRLLKPFLTLVALATLLGIGNGLGVTALLALINEVVTGTITADKQVALRFSGLCVLIAACALFSNYGTGYVGQRVLAQLRKQLAARIMSAPIDQLERYGSHKLIPVLVHDTGVLSTFVLSVAPLVVALSVTVAGVTYLSLLSPPLLLMTMLAIAIGVGAQWLAYRVAMPHVNAARDAEDDLQKCYEAISDGAKELRMHRLRRQRLLTRDIYGAADRICQQQVSASKFFITAETFGSILFFVLIGVVILAQSTWYGADKTVLGGFVLIMLYLKGPLAQLNDAMPFIGSAQVSLRRIIDLNATLSSLEKNLLINDNLIAEEALNDAKIPTAAPTIDTIELRDIRYGFPNAGGGEAFGLGPINLTIERGDIVFIVGENGSGKTTLIKLLLGLYTAHSGDIFLNGEAITDTSRDDYRQSFTTVFSDYYLFDDLSPGANFSQPGAQKYLERLDLAHKVDIRDGAFSTTDLSTGQRKRLALLNAWLENRPVLLFDEWAADQDPTFRRVFYTELLPELKRMGKTVIAISHDDRYFDVADHIVRMEGGRIMTNFGATESLGSNDFPNEFDSTI